MQTQLTPQEIIERGEKIYAAQIKEKGKAARRGEIILFDLDTNDYEIGKVEEEAELSDRLHARRPNGNLYCIRIGARGTYSLGGTL